MTTTKSYSDKPQNSRFLSMYKSALKTQLPFAIVTGIIFFIVMIVVYIASTSNQYDKSEFLSIQRFYNNYFWQGIYMDSAQNVLNMVLLAGLAVASAMVAFSFLHNKKTVDLYHSLPVTRPQLLTANALAGFTAVIVPFVAMYALTMAIQLISAGRYFHFGLSYFAFSLVDLLCICIYIAVIYLFIAVIAVNVGTVFDMFAVSGAIGFIPIIVYLVCGWIWDSLLYGASFSPSENIVFRLSPFTFMFERYIMTVQVPRVPAVPELASSYIGNNYIEIPDYPKVLLLALCGIIVAAILYIVAMVCYRRRKSEIAEQTQPRGILQTIVKFAAALLGGAMFFAIFNESGLIAQVIAMLLGSVAIGLIAELILSRGVRSIKRNIKWLAGAAAVYCVLLVVLSLDIFGYENRVPALDSVQSVKLSYHMGRFDELSTWHHYSYDNDARSARLVLPESIEVVRDAHKLAVDKKPGSRWMGNEFTWANVQIEYTLKNGSKIKRAYNEINRDAYARLVDLEDKDDFITSRSGIFRLEQYGRQSDLVDYIELYGNIDSVAGNHKVFLDDYGTLMEAVKSDMLNQSLEDIKNPKGPALGYLRVQYKEITLSHDRYSSRTMDPREDVIITTEFTNTLAELERLGLAEKLAPKLDEVKRVGFAPVWYWRGDDSRVISMLPWNGFNFYVQLSDEKSVSIDEFLSKYDESGQSDALVVTSDKSDIEAAARVGMSQLTQRAESDKWKSEYTLVCFVFEDGSFEWKIARISDLPAALSAKVQQNIDGWLAREEELNQGYYYGKPSAATM